MAIPGETRAIHGDVDDGFGFVFDAFKQNFDQNYEVGAALAVRVDGRLVVDLWGGVADKWGRREWRGETLANIYSVTKAATALTVAALVDEGLLDYETKVSAYWPEFQGEGKETISLGQLMSHQSGLPGIVRPIAPEDWYKHDWLVTLLERQTPLFRPGAASGYEPVVFGVMVQEVVKRATGKTVGVHFKERFGDKGVDVHIGVPEHLTDKDFADLLKPPAPPHMGEMTEMKSVAFIKNPTPGGRKAATDEWRQCEMPAVNGHASARGVAAMFEPLARGGLLGEDRLLSEEAVAAATRERIVGRDLILPIEASWAAGFLRNHDKRLYGPNEETVGHSGWGGAFGCADPVMGVSVGYVMNKMSEHLIGDPRGKRLLRALYLAL